MTVLKITDTLVLHGLTKALGAVKVKRTTLRGLGPKTSPAQGNSSHVSHEEDGTTQRKTRWALRIHSPGRPCHCGECSSSLPELDFFLSTAEGVMWRQKGGERLRLTAVNPEPVHVGTFCEGAFRGGRLVPITTTVNGSDSALFSALKLGYVATPAHPDCTQSLRKGRLDINNNGGAPDHHNQASGLFRISLLRYLR
ncbi:hypothetical protein AOLI_G00190580 [Acnodon oligacanthus]